MTFQNDFEIASQYLAVSLSTPDELAKVARLLADHDAAHLAPMVLGDAA